MCADTLQVFFVLLATSPITCGHVNLVTPHLILAVAKKRRKKYSRYSLFICVRRQALTKVHESGHVRKRRDVNQLSLIKNQLTESIIYFVINISHFTFGYHKQIKSQLPSLILKFKQCGKLLADKFFSTDFSVSLSVSLLCYN